MALNQVVSHHETMGGSVGPDGANDPQHFTYVHALVNDWRAGTGGTLIAIDGSFERGDGCWSALCDVKRAAEFEDPDSLGFDILTMPRT
jgi:hypothetical protein